MKKASIIPNRAHVENRLGIVAINDRAFLASSNPPHSMSTDSEGLVAKLHLHFARRYGADPEVGEVLVECEGCAADEVVDLEVDSGKIDAVLSRVDEGGGEGYVWFEVRVSVWREGCALVRTAYFLQLRHHRRWSEHSRAAVRGRFPILPRLFLSCIVVEFHHRLSHWREVLVTIWVSADRPSKI